MNKDKVLTCINCGQEFAFTTGEQEFYKQKGLSEPTHCPICRAMVKASEEDKAKKN